MGLENWAKYELFIVVGFLIAAGSAFKIFGNYDFSSDWFWLLAGVGLVVEGTISYIKQTKFEKKFKVLSRDEYEKLVRRKKHKSSR